MAIANLLAMSLASSFTLQSYLLTQDINEQSDFNRNNQVIDFSLSQAEVQLRGDFSWQGERFEVSLKPRITQSWAWSKEAFSGGLQQQHLQGRLNEGAIVFYLSDNWSLDIAREVPLWGASLFTNITNPLYPNNGKNNPYQELGGTDNVRLSYLSDDNWSVAFYANIAQGERTLFAPQFAKSYVLQADYIGMDYSLGAVLSQREGRQPKLAIYGQWTYDEATILYAESNFSHADFALYPETADNPVGFDFAHRDDQRYRADLVLGASYVFEHRGVLGLELAHLSHGYSAGDASRYFQAGASLNDYFGAQTADLALFGRLTHQALGNGLNALRKNYGFASYMISDVGETTDINLRLAYNLDDGSKQLVAIIGHFIGADSKIFLLLNKTLGDQNSEYNLLFDSQVYLGFEKRF